MGRKTKIVAVLGAAVVVVLLSLVLFYEPIEEGKCKLKRKKADPESQLLGLALQLKTPLTDKPDFVRDVPTDFEKPRFHRNGGKRKLTMM